MVDFSTINMNIIWIALAIVFGVLELATVQLVSIWFVFGAVAALVASMLNAAVYVQVIIFVAVTVLALVITRPIFKKYIKTEAQPTNADRVIGQTATVIEEIDNINSTGQVKVDGKIWSAKSFDDTIIPVDSLVTVEKIVGVKLIVIKD